MSLGLSFGSNGTRSTETLTGTQTTTGTQGTTGTQSSTGSTTGSTSTSSTGSQTGSTSQNTAGTSSSTATGTQNQRARSTQFSDGILSALERAFLGTTQNANQSVDTSGLNFDSKGFVEGGVQAAKAQQDQEFEAAINQLTHSVGGSTGTNSASALLANKMSNQNAAALAGVRSNLTGTAAQIAQGEVQTRAAVQGQANDIMTQLAGVLRGGVATTEGDTTTTSAEQQASQQQANSLSSQQQQQTQLSQQQTMETLTQLISQLVNSNSTVATNQTQTSNSRTRGGGVGFTL